MDTQITSIRVSIKQKANTETTFNNRTKNPIDLEYSFDRLSKKIVKRKTKFLFIVKTQLISTTETIHYPE